jgi:hypothetical protein
MAKPKKPDVADTEQVIVANRAILKDSKSSEETIKAPLLTAPVLPIETLDDEESNNPPAPKEKPVSKAVKKPTADEDTSQIIPVKRVSIKPPTEIEPPTEPETPSETEPHVQPLVDSPTRAASKPEPTPESSEEPKPETEPPAEPEPEKKPETAPETEAGDAGPRPSKADVEAEAKLQAEHEAAVQKLVDGKKYFLPINAVEQRRSKRFVIAGVLLSLLLLIAWADIALDAGLIDLPNVKPVTHFFSN